MLLFLRYKWDQLLRWSWWWWFLWRTFSRCPNSEFSSWLWISTLVSLLCFLCPLFPTHSPCLAAFSQEPFLSLERAPQPNLWGNHFLEALLQQKPRAWPRPRSAHDICWCSEKGRALKCQEFPSCCPSPALSFYTVCACMSAYTAHIPAYCNWLRGSSQVWGVYQTLTFNKGS